MSSETIFLIIAGIFVFDFIFEQTLDYLNFTTIKDVIPSEAAGIYSPEKYTASIAYQKEKAQFGFVSAIFGFVLSAIMLFAGQRVDGLFTPRKYYRIPGNIFQKYFA